MKYSQKHTARLTLNFAQNRFYESNTPLAIAFGLKMIVQCCLVHVNGFKLYLKIKIKTYEKDIINTI